MENYIYNFTINSHPYISVVGIIGLFFGMSAWNTQTIAYHNRHLPFIKIEHQMQSTLRYNQRTVQVIYLTSLFMWVSPVPNDIDKHPEWMKVDEYVNYLGLK